MSNFITYESVADAVNFNRIYVAKHFFNIHPNTSDKQETNKIV